MTNEAVPAMRRLCVVTRSWRGDPLIQELSLPLRALLFELHTLAVDLGTWPQLPSDPGRVAAMMRLNIRPVERGLDDLRRRSPALVFPVKGDAARMELRRVDAILA